MSASKILGDKDVNAVLADGQPLVKDVKSMEYHRQVFQSKIAQEPYVFLSLSLPCIVMTYRFVTNSTRRVNRSKQYVSPSDTIMSPCTAKLSALRNKQVTKYVPLDLIARYTIPTKLYIPIITKCKANRLLFV